MELSLELLWNKRLKKVGTSGTYPSTDNCYVVDVYDRETNEFEYTIHFCPKPIFELWEDLREMKAKYGIGKTSMLPILRGINDWGEWKYDQGVDSEMMNNAGEDL
jgi:hypothetical protein